ncbi:MAG: FGGY-family carbohydrate kinase [Rikenellaceae bacterium]
MNYVIAYDLGTGGIKASLVAQDGAIKESIFVAYDTYFPTDDFQEQAPEDWWKAVKTSTKKLLEASKIDAQDIKSLAISGHSLGVVPIGKNGELLRDKTPIWSDQRATKQADDFFAKTDYKQWYMQTGCGFPAPCYSIFKIMWYRDMEKEMYDKIDKIIGTKDYCNYKFTGRLCTDYSYASGTGVYSLKDWSYKDEFIAASEVDKDILPEIIASDAVVGLITEEAAEETGLAVGTAVVCGGVDNSCMALGAKGIAPARTYTSLGSSSWIAVVDNEPIVESEYKPYVFAHVLKGMYASALCIFSAGSSLQWVRNNMFTDLVEAEKQGKIKDSYDAISTLAANSPVGAKGLIFNPSLSGGSSIEPSPMISGAFLGLRLKHTREDIARATMEGIALNLRFALDILGKFCPDIKQMLVVGGGAKSPFWMQLFANIYGTEILKTNVDQMAASLGAAALAFNGVGLWEGYSIIDELHSEQSSYFPSESEKGEYDKLLESFIKATNLISQIN